MADYKDIIGTAVRNNAGNLPSGQNKELFFDTTNIDFKYQFAAVLSSWRTQNSLNTARDFTAGAGTATSALCFGGLKPPGEVLMSENESWNGTSWTEIVDLSQARIALAGSGTSTSALAFGGTNPPSSEIGNVEELTVNGPVGAWATGGSLNTARIQMAGCRIFLTASLPF